MSFLVNLGALVYALMGSDVSYRPGEGLRLPSGVSYGAGYICEVPAGALSLFAGPDPDIRKVLKPPPQDVPFIALIFEFREGQVPKSIYRWNGDDWKPAW
jgi:hypothetical protein